MSVDIRIDGTPLWNNSGYSVIEDSTPVDPSDSSGGFGQISFDTDEMADARSLRGKVVDLEDGSQGTTAGIVRGLSATNGELSVTADSRLSMLSAERTAQPFSGTLNNAFIYYLGLFGIVDRLVVEDSLESIPVVFQGWRGNGWDKMKELCAALQIEVALVSDNVVLRPLRGRLAENQQDASAGWAIDESQLARTVEVYYYQNEYAVDRIAYPDGGWNDEVPVLTVEAGVIETITIPITASLKSIQQPVCVSSVDRFYTDTSVYSVVGAGEGSSLPITPAQWAAGGGSLTVQISEDTLSLEITLIGSSDTRYAPYSIAMTAGPSDTYSSLRIIGEGVFSRKEMITLATSVDHNKVSVEVGATVDSPFISSIDQAYQVGLWTLKRWGSPRHTISVTSTGINRLGDSGSYRYATIAEFNAENAGRTIAQFNAIWAGKTVAEFNAYWDAKVLGDYDNQAFGNVAGSRIRVGDAMFRIRTATLTESSIVYTAEEDTTIADFNAVWEGADIAAFNAQWAGKTFRDFVIAPLWRTA